jgi:predicted transcriptional regulator YdeE
MKVMVIIKASPASEAGEMPSQQLLTEMGNFNEELAKAGVMLAGEGLHPSSKGARVSFGKGQQRLVTDGPFAETKELIAGFWIWKVQSMDEAIAWVKRCPNPHDEPGEVEIRPIFEADDFGEVFTPALREQEASVRAQGLGLGAVRFENIRELRVAGLNQRYTNDTRTSIPAQWQRFAPHLGKVPGQIGKSSYGVCWNFGENCAFDYLSGAEVADGAKLPLEFARTTVPARRYAVFTHAAHVSSLPGTMSAVHGQWAPESGLKIAQAPVIEHYTEQFDAQTGQGGIELWIPLEA